MSSLKVSFQLHSIYISKIKTPVEYYISNSLKVENEYVKKYLNIKRKHKNKLYKFVNVARVSIKISNELLQHPKTDATPSNML